MRSCSLREHGSRGGVVGSVLRPKSTGDLDSIHPDVRLANDPTILVMLVADKGREIRATLPNGIKTQGGKLRLDVRCLHRSGEPAGELRQGFFRRLRGGDHAEPVVDLDVFV